MADWDPTPSASFFHMDRPNPDYERDVLRYAGMNYVARDGSTAPAIPHMSKEFEIKELKRRVAILETQVTEMRQLMTSAQYPKRTWLS